MGDQGGAAGARGATMIEHFYESIDGNSIDIPPLYKLMVDNAKDGARFVELGAYKGRSTAFLLTEIANSGKAIDLHVIDLWEDAAGITRNASHPYEPATMAEFEANIAPVGNPDWLHVIKADTAQVAEHMADESFDFVFIDGDHSYDGCLRDIKAWLPKVKPGGVIAGHDFHLEYPGVMKAVREVFGADYKQSGIVWAHMVPQP
jgi:predicted O-methyltransferase YrrM